MGKQRFFFIGIICMLMGVLFPIDAAAKYLGNGRELADLMLLPESGSWWGETLLPYSKERAKQSNAVYTVATSERSRLPYVQSLGYAFLERYSITVKESFYFYDQSRVQHGASVGGELKVYKYSGFSDPEFHVKKRLTATQKEVYDLDLLFAYSPGIVVARKATTTNVGSEGRGGDQISFGIDFGNKFKKEQWKGNLSYKFFQKQKLEDPNRQEQITTSRHYTLAANIYVQVKIRHDFWNRWHFGLEYLDKEYSRSSRGGNASVVSRQRITLGVMPILLTKSARVNLFSKCNLLWTTPHKVSDSDGSKIHYSNLFAYQIEFGLSYIL
ncbi:MAG: hypothetical protein HQK50_04990 [Oligoflexia bacterium]|nr:hypothetical protein [Oligoflexia bacterium]MBF0364903.1 hypothetical protein [Oligoflexia bacterium]